MPRTGGPAIDEESVIRLRNALLRTARRMRTSGDPEGLSASQSSVLATLVREGPLRAGDLAGAEALNPTMLSRILAHLEERGLAVRGPDPDDGRATLARATADGRRLVERLRARRAAILMRWLDDLTPEGRASLVAALPALEQLGGGARP
ncbi:MAG TPA: MarR family transcriptional regulator [Miltoncostaeaceae bacterium]|nr:MarR family transcriptional regulator [Miltoncostaeaceae bacterium]